MALAPTEAADLKARLESDALLTAFTRVTRPWETPRAEGTGIGSSQS